jgi:chromosome segregation ATPase
MSRPSIAAGLAAVCSLAGSLTILPARADRIEQARAEWNRQSGQIHAAIGRAGAAEQDATVAKGQIEADKFALERAEALLQQWMERYSRLQEGAGKTELRASIQRQQREVARHQGAMQIHQRDLDRALDQRRAAFSEVSSRRPFWINAIEREGQARRDAWTEEKASIERRITQLGQEVRDAQVAYDRARLQPETPAATLEQMRQAIADARMRHTAAQQELETRHKAAQAAMLDFGKAWRDDQSDMRRKLSSLSDKFFPAASPEANRFTYSVSFPL